MVEHLKKSTLHHFNAFALILAFPFAFFFTYFFALFCAPLGPPLAQTQLSPLSFPGEFNYRPKSNN
jgi:hypothetical protein